MRTQTYDAVQFGELVAAAFDNAERYSTNPREVSRLATELVVHMLRRVNETSHSPGRQSSIEKGNA